MKKVSRDEMGTQQADGVEEKMEVEVTQRRSRVERIAECERCVGIDLGKHKSHGCVMDWEEKILERIEFRTTRAGFAKQFALQGPCLIAIESGRDSGWVYEYLMQLGHEVVVADTSRSREIGIGRGGRKNDRRDAEALARAAARGMIPEAHVLSHLARKVRDVLHARDALVQTRSRLVTMLRGHCQARGEPLASCTTKAFPMRVRSSELSFKSEAATVSVLSIVEETTQQIAVLEGELEKHAEAYEAYKRLCTVPSIALVTALAFMSVIDDPKRFQKAMQVGAFVGLAPGERSTGGKRRQGRVTKCGNRMLRALLVQAAHVLLNSRRHENDPLFVWGKQIEARKGRKKAAVAVARRLAGILWAMWRDGTEYDPQHLARTSYKGLSGRARKARKEARMMEPVQFEQTSVRP